MRTVSSETENNLKKSLVVGHAGARVVARELQADAAELRRTPVDHGAVARRIVVGEEQRRLSVGQPESVRGRAVVETVVAVADAPARHELVDALQVPARLPAV